MRSYFSQTLKETPQQKYDALAIKCKELGIPIESTLDYKLSKQFMDKLISEGLDG